MNATPTNAAHVAVCPSAGIGHLIPFLRLASMLASNTSSCTVTLIIIRPTLSTAEANQINTFLSTHPHITSSEFHALPPLTDSNIPDPFFLQYDAVTRSSHLLVDHLSALSPPISAVFSDIMLASGINKPLSDLGISNYNVITTSARFFSFTTSLTHQIVIKGDDVVISGLSPIPGDEIPPIFCNPDHLFTRLVETSSRHLQDAKGIVLNSFDFFDAESISALQNGKVLACLPSVYPVGPFFPYGSTNGNNISWLDKQPSKSVVYVSFGSRTTMSKEQIREIGNGLMRSELRFLWVIKTTVVDKDDKEELKDLLSEAFLENTKERGLILREWVNQEEVLDHPAIGGFVTHCGWNSVMEAAQRGVPLLAWPLHGDQRVNAGVVEKAGLGIWDRSWGWSGVRLVKGDEIAMKIEEMMTSEKLRSSATRVGEEAIKAWEMNGSSRKMFEMIIGDGVSRV